MRSAQPAPPVGGRGAWPGGIQPGNRDWNTSTAARIVTKLLLATSNPAKLQRLNWVVGDLGYVIVTPHDLAIDASARAEETGKDFAENAALKAVAWSSAAGDIPAVATDGGLRIPALEHGWNALTTKRNAGEKADDGARALHLLSLMEGLHGEARRTYWHEAVAFACGRQVWRTWSAVGDGGYIAHSYEPTGTRTGFWTEDLRYYPAVGALYRDLDARQLGELDIVWPTLRRRVRAYLKKWLDADPTGRG
jgi:inosine/xanthosine triphosphate pyrophosphatase family protein